MKPMLSRVAFHVRKITAVSMLLLVAGCGGGGGSNDSSPGGDPGPGSNESDSHAPVIASVRPAVVVAGQTVKVSGSNFDTANITYNGAEVAAVLQTPHEIRFVVPENAAGIYQLSLENGDGSADTALKQSSPLSGLGQIASGKDYSCALIPLGDIYCWGSSSLGQFGDTAPANFAAPVLVGGVTGALSMSTADGNSCAVLANGKVRCWGVSALTAVSATAGGINIDRAPQTVAGIDAAVSVSVNANDRSCAVIQGGSVYCWGWTLQPPSTGVREQPVVVTGVDDAIAVSMGNKFGCALRANKQVSCWRSDDGYSYTLSGSPLAEPIAGITDALYVSAGDSHVCALSYTGKVHCWGSNAAGQLGNGTSVDSETPVEVSGIDQAMRISAMGDRTCAVISGGTVKCWGALDYGFDGTGIHSLVPVAVDGMTTADTVSVGGRHNCVLTASGEAFCWGGNWNGELGVATLGDGNWLAPVTVSGVSNARAISEYAYHSCLVTTEGGVGCWGSNLLGELGDGTSISRALPVAASGISDATTVIVSSNHSCTLLADGSVSCWGGNAYGQLGDGSTTDSLVPVAARGIDGAVALATAGSMAVSSTFSCAVLASGGMQCWGQSDYGFGDGITESALPVAVAGISDAAAVSLDTNHGCVLLLGGKVRCWGFNFFGALGDGSGNMSTTPVEVAGITDASQVSTGHDFSCALLTTGSVKCWGWNEFVAPTPGGMNYALTPVEIAGIGTGAAIASGANHSCVVLTTGAVRCWGRNGSGQLGNGTITDSNVPVTVAGITTAVAIATSDDRSCALLSDGYLQCWGANDNDGAVVSTPALAVYLQ